MKLRSNSKKDVKMWEEILEIYPHGFGGQSWTMEKITKHVSWLYIEQHPNGIGNQPWDINVVSSRCPWNFLINNPEGFAGQAWKIGRLCENPNLQMDYVCKHPEGFFGRPWNIYMLTWNKNFDSNLVDQYPQGLSGQTWNMKRLSRIVPWQLVEKYPYGIGGRKWDMSALSRRCPWEFIQRYPRVGKQTWVAADLCNNENLDFNYADENFDDFFGSQCSAMRLSSNPKLQPVFVEKHPHYLWDMPRLSEIFPMEYIVKHPYGINGNQWNILILSQYLPWEFILQNPQGFGEYRWSIDRICCNLTLDMKYVRDHPEGFSGQSWNAKALSWNENLDFSLVEKYPDGFVLPILNFFREKNTLINKTIHFIQTNCYPFQKYCQWDMLGLSYNKNINWDFVDAHQCGFFGKPWDMYALSTNPSLTWKFVENHINGIADNVWHLDQLSNQIWDTTPTANIKSARNVAQHER